MKSYKIKLSSRTAARIATGTTEKSLKWKSYKNLVALGISFFLLFSVFQALSTLQTSVNAYRELGSTSMCIIYGFFICSGLFLPKLLISYLTIKWTMVLCMFMYTSFVAVNFKPAWYTLFPTSVLLGLAAGPLWISQSVYVTSMSKLLSKPVSGNEEKNDKNRVDISVISTPQPPSNSVGTMVNCKKFTMKIGEIGTRTIENSEQAGNMAPFLFGIFFTFYNTGMVFGQLISSLTLRSDIVTKSRDNYSIFNHSINCGSAFCFNYETEASIFKPSLAKMYTLYAVYTAVSLSALLVVAIFVDNLPRESVKDENGIERDNSVSTMCLSTLNQMRDPRQLLLIPLSVYYGLHQGFISADFSKAYVTCYYGVAYLGFVMMVYGGVSAIVCPISGYLTKKLPCWSLFLIAAITHSCIVYPTLTFATQDFSSHFYLMFIVAGLSGFFYGLCQPQISGLYSSIFPRNPEPAFANHRLWESVGVIISFSYHEVLCMKSKLIFLTAILALATVSYIVLETRLKRKSRDNQHI
ncbi:unnamed protein product [Gordionus sp. m RMFG-2023]|uniref:protein unc-93 homolog A-like n=1 Tax=Gordionus sp. m RMFG-2023 TaxID=3053472 RepID=UPI0030E0E5DA